MRDPDVIIVGAGPAGCAAAYDLAASGVSVLLLDRHQFPRVKACAGALTIKALAALRYPIDPVIRRVCRTMGLVKNSGEGRTLRSRHAIAVSTVRSELDHFCLARTLDKGVAFEVVREIRGIDESDTRVTVTSEAGPIRGRYLIGADGANSTVRRLGGRAAWFGAGLAIEACVMVDGTIADLEFDFGAVQRGYGWTFHKGDHLNVGLYTSDGSVRVTKEMLSEYARARVGTRSLTGVVGQRVGFGGWKYTPASERIFLVGDAAGLVDPLLGEGIYNAIVSGQRAAEAIAGALRGGANARRLYATALRVVQHDVLVCERSAMKFYWDLEQGYAALTSPVVRYALIRGYAAGLTFSETRRRFFLAPFWRPAPVSRAGNP